MIVRNILRLLQLQLSWSPFYFAAVIVAEFDLYVAYFVVKIDLRHMLKSHDSG